MINFRYHVVSIIGIFIALAVGVVLGAGPLQRTINTGMNPSSSAASSDPALSAQADAEAAGLKALASSTLTGSLSGSKIALVVLPGASEDDVSAIRSTLTDAGASVVGRVSLTDNWQSTSMSQYRSTLSTSLSSHLSSSGAKGASADGVVGHAIIQVLTETGPETDLLRQILTDKSTPLMMIDEDPAGGATTIVAIGPRAQTTATASSAPASADAWTGLARPSTRSERPWRPSTRHWPCPTRPPALAPTAWARARSPSSRPSSKPDTSGTSPCDLPGRRGSPIPARQPRPRV